MCGPRQARARCQSSTQQLFPGSLRPPHISCNLPQETSDCMLQIFLQSIAGICAPPRASQRRLKSACLPEQPSCCLASIALRAALATVWEQPLDASRGASRVCCSSHKGFRGVQDLPLLPAALQPTPGTELQTPEPRLSTRVDVEPPDSAHA